MTKRSALVVLVFVAGVVTLGGMIVGQAEKASETDAPTTDSVAAQSARPVSEQVGVEWSDGEPATGVTTIAVPAIVTEKEALYVNRVPLGDRPLGREETESARVGPRPISEKWDGEAGPMDTGQAPPNRAVGANFDSLGWSDNGAETGFVFIPPDPSAAAGQNHLVNVVNVMARFHDKTGTVLWSDSLKDFFTQTMPPVGYGNPTTWTFDPKVIYDQYADRFVIVTLEQTDTPADTSYIFLAVSDDGNPMGTWYVTRIDAKTTISTSDCWADYPGFAVDDEAVYITSNLFQFSGFPSAYDVRLWIVDKGIVGGFYAGAAAAVAKVDPFPAGSAGDGLELTTQPAHVFGAAPAGVGTLMVGYSGLSNGGVGGTEAFIITQVDNPLTTPTFTSSFVEVDIENVGGSYGWPALPDAPQLGSVNTIEVNDRRALHAVWRADQNALWFTTTINPNFGTEVGQTTALWGEINTTTLAALTLTDFGVITGEDIAPTTYTFFPSIAVNAAGYATVGFSACASTIYAGSYFAVLPPTFPAGQNAGAELVRAGTDFYLRTFGAGRNRWGDYTGAAVDPADQCFWVYNEHAITRSGTPPEDGRWGTAYAQTCPVFLDGFEIGSPNSWSNYP